MVKQQGYSKTQLNNAVEKKTFLAPIFKVCISGARQCHNPHECAGFLCENDIKEFINLRETPQGYITRYYQAVGCMIPGTAGSLLEIKLDKEVVIPKNLLNLT